MESRYFLTVDWCKKGKRGIFCDGEGKPFSLDRQHTREEMDEILGVFWMVLDPQSVLFTEAEAAAHNRWYPLEEYSNVFGYAVPSERDAVPAEVM